jgi:hypothetical protein
MTTAVVDIYNMALGQVGIDTAVSIPSEDSYEAETCTRYYDLVRKHALSAAHWPFARAAFRLNLLATKNSTDAWTAGDPEPGWIYAYGLPGDYLHARHLATYGIFNLSAHTTAGGQVSRGLVSNEKNAVLVYTKDVEDPAQWDSTFTLAVSCALGAFIAKPLTGKKDLYTLLVQQTNMILNNARAIVANADGFENERNPEWIDARGSAYRPLQQQTFIWPHGPLFQEQAPINT